MPRLSCMSPPHSIPPYGMERYLLCGEILSLPQTSAVYKGRRRGTVEFFTIHKYDKTAKDRVANGVRLVQDLDHAHVLMFHEWYKTPKHIWVITELANGGMLADILEQDSCLPFPQVVDFMRDIASGLSYVHSRQIVYCDLQPHKVMLDSCQCLKLSDFSLARQVKEEEESTHHQNKEDIMQAARAVFQQYCTTSGGRTGHCSVDHTPELAPTSGVVGAPSPFYAAPEIFSGGQFTFTSDLWSLGCLLFEMCTGRRPFHGTSAGDLVQRICHETPDMSGLPAGSSLSEMRDLVSHLLHKSPQQRLSWQQLLKFSCFRDCHIS